MRILRELRERAGIKQSVLAKRMRVSPPTIVSYESYSRNPQWDTIKNYAKALGYRARIVFEKIEEKSDVQ